jgi:hypothetical protein
MSLIAWICATIIYHEIGYYLGRFAIRVTSSKIPGFKATSFVFFVLVWLWPILWIHAILTVKIKK